MSGSSSTMRMRVMSGRRRQNIRRVSRDDDRERTAAALLAFEFDPAGVRSDDVRNHRQPKAGAIDAAPYRVAAADKLLEDALTFLRRDAEATISNGNRDVFFAPSDGHGQQM